MGANRWTAWSLCSITAAILGTIAAVTGWYRFWMDGSPAFGLLGAVGTLALASGLWLRCKLGPEPRDGFRATEGDATDAESRFSLMGRVAVEMLVLVAPRFHYTDYYDRAPRPRRPLWAAAILAGVAVPLLIAALSPRLTVDSCLAVSGGFALSIMAMYLLILGLFIPASMIERDARLRKFLADIGVNSILAVRLVGVIMALAAAALVVFGLI